MKGWPCLRCNTHWRLATWTWLQEDELHELHASVERKTWFCDHFAHQVSQHSQLLPQQTQDGRSAIHLVSTSKTVCMALSSSGPYATPSDAIYDLKGSYLHLPHSQDTLGGKNRNFVLGLCLFLRFWFLCFNKVSCRPDWLQTSYSTTPVLGLELRTTTPGCESLLSPNIPVAKCATAHALLKINNLYNTPPIPAPYWHQNKFWIV